jgi:hypothetical protein
MQSWRQESNVCGDALRGHTRVNLKAVIVRLWRCTLEAVIERVSIYPLSGHDHADLDAVIECVSKYTWRS